MEGMISSEVQRTLVKSAPELWAELSDPAALARHLGEFGEIRITRTNAEREVEWEALDGDTSGAVLINPSGWGTKVRLTVTREIPESESKSDAVAEAESAPAAISEADAEGASVAEDEPYEDPEPPPLVEIEPYVDLEPEPLAQAAPELLDAFGTDDEAEFEPALELVAEPERERRRGFFARLFGRRRIEEPAEQDLNDGGTSGDLIEDAPADEFAELPRESAIIEPVHEPPDALAAWAVWAEQAEPVAVFAPEPEPLAPTSIEEGAAELAEAPIEGATSAEPSDISAPMKPEEEVAAEQVTALLTDVLDRLGAAHHRPFSRA
jgi:hypothetical protein